MTNQRVQRMFAALTTMANRFLPSVAADIRVANLINKLEPISRPIAAGRARVANDIIAAHGGPEAIERLGDMAQQAILIEIQVAQDGYDAEAADLDISSWKLVDQSMLPRERAGDDGWKNGANLGAIIADLGPLFEPPKE